MDVSGYGFASVLVGACVAVASIVLGWKQPDKLSFERDQRQMDREKVAQFVWANLSVYAFIAGVVWGVNTQ